MRTQKLTVLMIVFILFWGGVIFLADQGRLPGLVTSLYAFPYGDKVGHFFLMGGLAFCVNLALIGCQVRIGHWRVLTGSLLVAAVVTLEEFSQLFFQSRTFDLRDLGFSLLGIWLLGRSAGLLIARVTR
jgi:polysaccharide biosynthesis protein VpsQ